MIYKNWGNHLHKNTPKNRYIWLFTYINFEIAIYSFLININPKQPTVIMIKIYLPVCSQFNFNVL